MKNNTTTIIESKLINDDSGVQWSEVTVEMPDSSIETFSVQLTDGIYDTAAWCMITVEGQEKAVDFDDYPEISEDEIISAAEQAHDLYFSELDLSQQSVL